MDSSMGKMTKKLSLAMVVMVAALVLAVGMPGQASALTCTQVGGADVGGNCTISTPITAFCPFVLTVPGDLLITSTGSIDCGDPVAPPGAGAQPITISVGGDMEMQTGSSIRAENSLAGGNGGNITLTVGGDFTMRGTSGGTAGAVISSSKTSNGDGKAGNIRITVGNVTVNPDDLTITCATTPAGDILVEAGNAPVPGQLGADGILANNFDGVAGNIKMFAGKNARINGLVSSVGLLGEGKGGQITIDACCDLVVGDTGTVISRGRDPGADLVHLQGCVVQIFGLVASTGPAHEPPFANVCNVNRPGKPADSGACVEIWAGTTLLIDSTGTHKGEVNADTATSGGTQGSAWIDILANDAITIRGNATAPVNPLVSNNDTNPAYAVHANQFIGNGHGGDITVISKDSTVTMFGRAIQANASTNDNVNGGKGGHIVIQGNLEVAFGTGVTPAFVQAAGDITPLGGSAAGGTVNAKSFNGNVTGIATSQISVLGTGGLATLTGCVDPAGTYLGIVIGTELDVTACGGSPTFPIPANTLLPAATCATSCQPPGNKSGVKFDDKNKNGVQDANEPGLIGWTIHVFDTVTMALLQTVVTKAADPLVPTPDGFYSFTLTPGSYTVCEELQAGWQQTKPLPGSVPPPVGETLANCGPFGVANGLTLGPRGYSFTITAAAEIFADNDFGNFEIPPPNCPKFPTLIADVTITIDPNNPTQIQDAINGLAPGKTLLILPFNGKKTESISINSRVKVVGCSITLTAANGSAPVVTIGAGAANGSTTDVHATGSTVAGYKIEGNSHLVENVRSFDNAIGFWITGNSNKVNGALGTTGNGIGFKIDGNGNTLDTNNGVEKNLGDGVLITGDGNTVKKYTVRSNGGNGIKVEATASGTILSEDKAFTNALNGFQVLGTSTKLSKNTAADNAGCEFLVVAGNTNGKDNKANNVTILPNVVGPFPTGCIE